MEITPTMIPKDEIDSASGQLRADLRTLSGDIEALKSDVAALGRNQVNRVRANVAEMDDSVGARLSQKPYQTLAIAFAAGYLFAVVSR